MTNVNNVVKGARLAITRIVAILVKLLALVEQEINVGVQKNTMIMDLMTNVKLVYLGVNNVKTILNVILVNLLVLLEKGLIVHVLKDTMTIK